MIEIESYAVLTTESKMGGTTTYTYTRVDVEVTVALAGSSALAFETKVKAAIPEATDYEHIHFGVWAALGEAEADGDQDVADLGIGFLQNYSGRGPDRRRHAEQRWCRLQWQLGRRRAGG